MIPLGLLWDGFWPAPMGLSAPEVVAVAIAAGVFLHGVIVGRLSLRKWGWLAAG